MVEGYIKLHRKLTEWGWYKDGNVTRVFLHLLLKANFTDGEFMGVTIKRGQVATSYQHIADELGISRDTAYRAIKKLEKTHELQHFPYNKFSVFTVLNYSLYQDTCNTSHTPNATQPERKPYNSPNAAHTQYKKEKNNKEEKEYSERFEKFFSSYPKKSDKENASKIFESKNFTDTQFEWLMQILEEDVESDSWTNENGKYIPRASKWLEEERYNRTKKSYLSGYRELTADD